MTFIATYLEQTVDLLRELDHETIEKCVDVLVQTKQRAGRLFCLGVGGSAANASHFVNDARKICGIEAYAPTDNVAEITARTNDDGWPATFAEWLDTSHLSPADCLLIFSVNGGTATTSPNIVSAIDLSIEVGCPVIGICGPLGGHTAALGTVCVKVPAKSNITPHSEGIAMVVSHLICSHPKLAR